MLDITHPKITEYLDTITPRSGEILREMEQRGKERDFPAIGPQVGRLLYTLVKLSGAKRIFEFGSGFGYSLFWMAQAAPDGARLIGTEYKQENVDAAADYFRRGGIADKAEVRLGEAVDTFNSLDGEFDIVVLDAEKSQYSEIFKLAAPCLKTGGLFIADNILWDGLVTEKTNDPDTRGIQEFTQVIFADPRFHSLVLPMRDGVSVSLKLRD